MTTTQFKTAAINTGNTSKKNPKVSEIIGDIKKGATASLIMEKHQIVPKQLKMIIIHCYKKGIIKKTDIVANFFSKNTHNNSDNVQTHRELPKYVNQPKNSINDKEEAILTAQNTDASESEENSVDLGDIVQLAIKKIKNEKMLLGKFSLSTQNVCAICMIVFFFLPWINLGGLVKFAGYEIPDAVKALGQLAAAFGETSRMNPKVHLFYILYLIPIFAGITIFLNQKGRNSKNAGLVTAAVPIISLIYFVYEIGSEILDVLAIGAYLTLFTALAIIYTTFPDQIKHILNKATH